MAFSERFFWSSSTISFEKEDLELIQFFLSSFKIISFGNSAVTFGALILYPNKRKYLVKKAFIYDETGVFIIVSGYCVLVRIYFSEEISASHMWYIICKTDHFLSQKDNLSSSRDSRKF